MVISHSWGVRIQVMCAWHLEQSVLIKRLLIKCLLPFLLHPYSCAECVGGCTCHWGLSWPQGGLYNAWFGAHIYIIIGEIRALETWQRLETPLCGAGPPLPCLAGLPRLHSGLQAFSALPSGTGPCQSHAQSWQWEGSQPFPAGLPHPPLLAQSGVMGTAD